MLPNNLLVLQLIDLKINEDFSSQSIDISVCITYKIKDTRPTASNRCFNSHLCGACTGSGLSSWVRGLSTEPLNVFVSGSLTLWSKWKVTKYVCILLGMKQRQTHPNSWFTIDLHLPYNISWRLLGITPLSIDKSAILMWVGRSRGVYLILPLSSSFNQNPWVGVQNLKEPADSGQLRQNLGKSLQPSAIIWSCNICS